MAITIAIDGPVGAGKSTIAQGLAEALGILHLDTGAMYRAMALLVLRSGADASDQAQVEGLLDGSSIDVRMSGNAQQTLLNGEDVSALIRAPEVSAVTSVISVYPRVRAHMVVLQRAYAARADMVVDGRDIGTRVLPDAPFKFYLDAPSEIRARRRYDELTAKGIPAEYETVLRELMERDQRDEARAIDPLRQAEDAKRIDTADMSREAVISRLASIVKGETNE